MTRMLQGWTIAEHSSGNSYSQTADETFCRQTDATTAAPARKAFCHRSSRNSQENSGCNAYTA